MGGSVFFRPHFFQNTRDIPSAQEILSATRHPIYALKEDADYSQGYTYMMLEYFVKNFRLRRIEENFHCVLYANSFNGLRSEYLKLVEIMIDNPNRY